MNISECSITPSATTLVALYETDVKGGPWEPLGKSCSGAEGPTVNELLALAKHRDLYVSLLTAPALQLSKQLQTLVVMKHQDLDLVIFG